MTEYATVVYAAVHREEVAYDLAKRLKSIGYNASPHYDRLQTEEVLFVSDEARGGIRLSWQEADDLVKYRLRQPQIPVKVLPHGKGLPLPAYETAGAAGMDLRAAITCDQDLLPGAYALIPTGLAMAIPEGYEVQVRPRSGLAVKHGISIVNSPGTVDCDYRGEIAVCLINLGSQKFTIERGDRIAQMVVAPVVQAAWKEVDALDETARGAGGYGSTGTR